AGRGPGLACAPGVRGPALPQGAPPMSEDRASRSRVVVLFDVDDTLLDNDQVTLDLRRYLMQEVGAGRTEQYFEIFEDLRTELGYADYLGALQQYRVRHPRDHHLLA